MTFPEELTPSLEAVIVVFPAPTAVTIPVESTVATELDDDSHLAVLATSVVSPLTVVPEAPNCFDSPITRKIDVGLTAIEFSASPDTKKSSQPLNATVSASATRMRTLE